MKKEKEKEKDKSYLLYRLKLPKDIIDCICSFVFYTQEQSIERNKQKFKDLFKDIQQIEISHIPIYYKRGGSFIFMIIQYPLREHNTVYTNLCNDCSNFINVKSYRCFGCNCFKI